MAMTEEELLLQMNILASKTSDNPNMTYKANKTLNKGLNPEFFSGNDSKIVNILNDMYSAIEAAGTSARNAVNKINEIVVDTSSADGMASWEHLQSVMNRPTIVQGLIDLYDGLHVDTILGLNPEDAGKILSIATDENGKAILSAINEIFITIESIDYENEKAPDVTNVKEALDYIFNHLNNNNNNDDIVSGPVSWENIENKPNIPSTLEISDDYLLLKDGENILSQVSLTSNNDIDQILNNLN
jgi:hypothetical protein